MTGGAGRPGWRTALLKAYGRVPSGLRQRVVRLVQPSYTLGVMAVITDEAGRVLLVRHSYLAGWAFPGGLVDRRERVEVALVREAREEVGVEIELVGAPAVTVDPVDQIVRVASRARRRDPSAEPAPASAEIVETRWFDVDELPDLVVSSSDALVALARVEAR